MSTHPIVSVCIPTYEAGPSLASTLVSIYVQSAFAQIREIILVVDGKKALSKKLLQTLRHPKLRIVYRSIRKGQSARINDLFRLASTPLVVLTNDDVLLDRRAVALLVANHYRTKADLVTAEARPMKPLTLLEWVISMGAILTHRLAKNWNNGDNYLQANGRLLLLSRSLYKKIKLPEPVWNNDAYMYIYARLNGFTHKHEDKAIVWYRTPKNLHEHFKQSHKFQLSQTENQTYFTSELKSFYHAPKQLTSQTLCFYLLKSPIQMVLFLGISLLGRLTLQKQSATTGYWLTDQSTKEI